MSPRPTERLHVLTFCGHLRQVAAARRTERVAPCGLPAGGHTRSGFAAAAGSTDTGIQSQQLVDDTAPLRPLGSSRRHLRFEPTRSSWSPSSAGAAPQPGDPRRRQVHVCPSGFGPLGPLSFDRRSTRLAAAGAPGRGHRRHNRRAALQRLARADRDRQSSALSRTNRDASDAQRSREPCSKASCTSLVLQRRARRAVRAWLSGSLQRRRRTREGAPPTEGARHPRSR